MNILYIGDNSDRTNWGCRATSIALGQIVSQKCSITGVVFGKEVSGGAFKPIICRKNVSAGLTRRLNSISTRMPKKISHHFTNWCGLRDDFISESSAESIRNFEIIYSKSEHLYRLKRWIDKNDAILVNGEGGYIFSTPGRRDHLFFNFIVKYAQTLGKKTYVVNGMISDCPASGRNEVTFEETINIFESCDGVSVRDPHSKRILDKRCSSLNVQYVPDALFSWAKDSPSFLEIANGMLSNHRPFGFESFRSSPDLNLAETFIALGGSSSAAWDQDLAFSTYDILIQELLKIDTKLLLVVTCPGDRFLYGLAEKYQLPVVPLNVSVKLGAGILGRAAVFISGRYHPSILASLSGTPCVFLGSNSHKTKSLQEVLGYDNICEYDACPNVEQAYEIRARVLSELYKSRRSVIRESVLSLCKDSFKIHSVLT